MTVTWSQRLNTAALQQLLRSTQGPAVQDLLRRGLAVESAAKRNLSGYGGPKRIDTGRLRASITTQVLTRNGEPAVIVGTNVNYARFVHDGTGIYGPHGRPIRPRHAKVLRWRGRTGRIMFARSVKGMRPNPFLRNALHAARR